MNDHMSCLLSAVEHLGDDAVVLVCKDQKLFRIYRIYISPRDLVNTPDLHIIAEDELDPTQTILNNAVIQTGVIEV